MIEIRPAIGLSINSDEIWVKCPSYEKHGRLINRIKIRSKLCEFEEYFEIIMATTMKPENYRQSGLIAINKKIVMKIHGWGVGESSRRS